MTVHTHTCPGGCGAELVGQAFACWSCTRRLPQELNAEITATFWEADWPAHAAALVKALHFFADHPRPTVHSEQTGESA